MQYHTYKFVMSKVFQCLGLESDDVDMAISNQKASEFGEMIQKLLRDKGHAASAIGNIGAAPHKGKMVDTATMKIFGTSIDLTTIRTRDPNGVKSWSSDAFMRDFTINALFYDLKTNTVEDPTGMGLRDLKDRILRLPLEGPQSFLDDPLRVLRAIRLKQKLKLKFHPSLSKAAKDPKVRKILEKVSKERFAKELNKIMTLGSVHEAMTILVKFDLHGVVFKAPSVLIPDPDVLWRFEDPARAVGSVGLKTLKRLELLLYQQAAHHERNGLDRPTVIAGLYGAFLSSYYGHLARVGTVGTGGSGRKLSAMRVILRESVRTSNLIAKKASSLFHVAHAFHKLAQQFSKMNKKGHDDLALLKTIMTKTADALLKTENDWRFAFLVARALVDSAEDHKSDSEFGSHQHCRECGLSSISQLKSLETWIEKESDLDCCWEWKPLVSAKEVIEKFGIKGREIGKIMDKQTEWRLQNPRLTRQNILDALAEWDFSDPVDAKASCR